MIFLSIFLELFILSLVTNLIVFFADGCRILKSKYINIEDFNHLNRFDDKILSSKELFGPCFYPSIIKPLSYICIFSYHLEGGNMYESCLVLKWSKLSKAIDAKYKELKNQK